MAIYLVTGRLGAGKSLACVGRIRDALREGRRVATNLDLTLEAMLKLEARAVDVQRIPDKPTRADLELLGVGNPYIDEAKNGLIVLDELGSWLNAREWGDKARQGVIDWLIHSRKYGWDVIFICQHIQQVDKQVRESLVEYHVNVRRLDRLSIPFVGGLVRLLSGGLASGRLPRIHVAAVRYGTEHNALVAERWVYRGGEFFGAYNTRQVFSPSYPHGVYSYLSPWHVKGRYTSRPWTVLEALRLAQAWLGMGPMGGWPLERVAAVLRGSGRKARARKSTIQLPVGVRGPQLRPIPRAIETAFRPGRAAAAPGGLSL
jgi:hypothetical protein